MKMSDRPHNRGFQSREINDGVVRTGVIDEARKDGVTYIHITLDAVDPKYPKVTQLIARFADVQITNPQVGQAVHFQRYIDDSGSQMAFNVVAA